MTSKACRPPPSEGAGAGRQLDPEDGRLTVLDLAEDETTAFTRVDVDNLVELVQIYKADPNLLPRPPE